MNSTAQSIGPEDGVFTCDWIARHPTEATAFRVSCRSDMVNPGADVERAAELEREMELTQSRGMVVLDDGSQCVPSNCGNIGPGVYAATGFHYSNTWTYSFGSANQTFYWYVKKTDGSIQVSGGPTIYGGTVNIAANNYRWQVYNAGTSPRCGSFSGMTTRTAWLVVIRKWTRVLSVKRSWM